MKTVTLPTIMPELKQKAEKLQSVFRDLGTVLVAFSGGIDSTLVLKMARETLGDQAIAVVAVSPTFPLEELEDVQRLSQEIGARLITAQTNQLEIADFVLNDASRCYHCKTDLYELFQPIKRETGIDTVVDGTNMDDLGDDRPGIQAARDHGVRSPLVEAGFTKADVRQLAQHFGLSNWNKPAAACLSSRIPRGLMITETNLRRVEKAEAILKQEGFRHVRVRDHEGIARIEVDHQEIDRFFETDRRQRISQSLKGLGFRWVTLDLEGYQVGGGN
ncbi:ATP-dependent sacrificial sulfur transferase LarE [Candidatus Nitronereus thalassa]|uniref:ATP-dependent sacrificial sulfur transferase LarE n=1 Tax=Candidatus Nitronereus thalassa TaxID=3020898 RepID=A0ABU3KA72_9BACT|nr:ATP-dependent sacrificial sulfur transferase LarE [Candidatus Nitronereus thalassa]MDT7043247.1 ATP-dependent sacrificial sulfur transferase LarE [Candidatus Nitronereus thalassa]